MPSRLSLVRIIPATLAILAVLAAVAWFGTRPGPAFPSIGGPFQLTAQDGSAFTDQKLRGKPSLVFFGYTHCPDVCPTTLWQMSELMRSLGPDPGVNAVFITVDPERDTPKVLAEYLSSFDSHIVGLTGTPEQIAGVLKSFRVYAKKSPGRDGDYAMDHSSVVYLLDKKGQFVGAFNLDRPPAEAAAQLRKMS